MNGLAVGRQPLGNRSTPFPAELYLEVDDFIVELESEVGTFGGGGGEGSIWKSHRPPKGKITKNIFNNILLREIIYIYFFSKDLGITNIYRSNFI